MPSRNTVAMSGASRARVSHAAGGDFQEETVLVRDDIRRARAVIEQRDFPEEIAGTERGQNGFPPPATSRARNSPSSIRYMASPRSPWVTRVLHCGASVISINRANRFSCSSVRSARILTRRSAPGLRPGLAAGADASADALKNMRSSDTSGARCQVVSRSV